MLTLGEHNGPSNFIRLSMLMFVSFYPPSLLDNSMGTKKKGKKKRLMAQDERKALDLFPTLSVLSADVLYHDVSPAG